MPRGGRRRSPLLAVLALGLLLIGAGCLILASYYSITPTLEVLGGDFPVNAGAIDRADLSAHNSPTLARSPVGGGSNLAIANRIDTPLFSCALHVSYDGGSSWTQTPIPLPRGEEPKCYAPDVAFGADGTLYTSFVTLKGRGNVPNAVWLVTSGDGGRTLSEPRKLLGPLSFQVRLTADPSRRERLYLTWLEAETTGLFAFPETGNPIRFSRSDDGGRTWSEPVRVSDEARARVVAPSPAVGPDGDPYLLYLDLGEDRLDYGGAHRGQGGPPYPGLWKLVLARSVDDGSTWRETVIEERLIPTERFVVFIPPFPSVAVGPDGDHVYASFHSGSPGDRDVFLWTSEDAGATWQERTRVNDTPEGDGTSQYLPRLAVAPNGRLDVVYYDRRDDENDVMNEVSLQSSFDGGESFTNSVRLSERAFDSRIGFGSERKLPDLGSRLGLVSTDSRALAVWTDTRSGTQASNKQDIFRALVAFTDVPTIAEPAKNALRYGGLALVLAGLVALALWAIGSRTVGEPAATA